MCFSSNSPISLFIMPNQRLTYLTSECNVWRVVLTLPIAIDKLLPGGASNAETYSITSIGQVPLEQDCSLYGTSFLQVGALPGRGSQVAC